MIIRPISPTISSSYISTSVAAVYRTQPRRSYRITSNGLFCLVFSVFRVTD